MKFILTCAMAAAILCGTFIDTAKGQVVVVVNGTTVQTVGSGAPITLTIGNTTNMVRIYSLNPAVDDIGRVTLNNGGGTNLITVLVTGPSGQLSTLQQPSAGRNWNGLVCTRTRVQFVGSVSGNLTGGILVSRLWRLDVGGTISSAVTSGVDSSDVGGPFFLRAESVGQGGFIQARAGNISLIQVFGSDMHGVVSCDQGSVANIDIARDIGFSGQSPVQTISAATGILNVSARNAFATFDPQISVSPATNSMSLALTGSLFGSIRTGSFSSFRIEDDLAGLVQVQQPVPAASVYRIGGSITNTGVLRFPASGLAGRVVVNDEDSSGQWATGGRVQFYVGSPPPTFVELIDPEYPEGASALVGGTIGLTRFRLHREDCYPTGNAVLDPSSTPSHESPILMRHYGPVEIQSGQGTPFTVTRRNPLIPSQYTDETDCFDVMEVDSANHTIVRVVPNAGYQFVRGYEYVVQRRRYDSGGTMENVLRCDLPSGASPQVFDYEPLTFTVCGAAGTVDAAAPGDADSDGCVNFADVTSVLTNFGFGPEICGKLGDADRNGTVEFADISSLSVPYTAHRATKARWWAMASRVSQASRAVTALRHRWEVPRLSSRLSRRSGTPRLRSLWERSV